MIELWEKGFQNANYEQTHNLYLHKSVIESEIESTIENNGNDGQNGKHGQDKLEVIEPGSKGIKDDRAVSSENQKVNHYSQNSQKGRMMQNQHQ